VGYLDECQVKSSFKALKYSQSGDSLASFVSEKSIGGNLGGGFVTIGTNATRYLDLTVNVTDTFATVTSLWNAQNVGTLEYTDGTTVQTGSPLDDILMCRLEFLKINEPTAALVYFTLDGGGTIQNDSIQLTPGEVQTFKVKGIGVNALTVASYADEATVRITGICELGNPTP